MTTNTVAKPARAKAERDQGGNPLEYLSASRLKLFAECRLKFYFKYVEQIPTAVTPALLIGKVTPSVSKDHAA